MGGYGAMTIGLRHPDMFCTIGSHSGRAGLCRAAGRERGQGRTARVRRREWSKEHNPKIKIEGFSTPADRTPKGKIFATTEQCDAHDPFKLVLKVDRAELPFIYVDCGTDDGLITSNQALLRAVDEEQHPVHLWSITGRARTALLGTRGGTIDGRAAPDHSASRSAAAKAEKAVSNAGGN